jgi:hypothetical protein
VAAKHGRRIGLFQGITQPPEPGNPPAHTNGARQLIPQHGWSRPPQPTHVPPSPQTANGPEHPTPPSQQGCPIDPHDPSPHDPALQSPSPLHESPDAVHSSSTQHPPSLHV